MADRDDDSKIFPQRLMEILAEEDNHDAICWLPHGRAFVVRDRNLFAEKVMPRYFSRNAKYSSFTRKLNRWYVAGYCFSYAASLLCGAETVASDVLCVNSLLPFSVSPPHLPQ